MGFGGTILVTDKKARLKPCLRCGYSLVRLADARRCPECGLAIRISLSDNTDLAWSNPGWQRFLVVAFGLMTTGFACTIVNATGDLIVSGYLNGYYAPDNTIWGIINRVSLVFDLMSLIICGASLCMISKGEGRYPDRSIGARRIFIVTGILVVAVGLTRLAFRFEFSDFLPYWLSSLVYRLLSGPWIPLIFAILVGACAIDLGKRSGSRSLLTMSHPPIYVTVIGFWVWLLNLQRFFPPLRSIVWEWAYPLSMIVVLVMMIRVLLQSSREAEENWATEA